MEVNDEVAQLELALKKLKFQYEQFFMGEEKIPPEKLQTDIDAKVRNLSSSAIKNVGARFRFSTFSSKYSAYKQNWARQLRLFEEGKFGRGKIKAKLDAQAAASSHAGTRLAPEPAEMSGDAGAEEQIINVYKEYLDAKKKCNEDTSGISLDKISDTIRKQTPVLMEKFKAKDVKFKVVIENGKAKLKAVPIT